MSETPKSKDIKEEVDRVVVLEDPELRGHAIIRLFRDIVGMEPGKEKEINPSISRLKDPYALKAIVRLDRALGVAKDGLEKNTTVPAKIRTTIMQGFDEYRTLMAPYVREFMAHEEPQHPDETSIFLSTQSNTWRAANDAFTRHKRHPENEAERKDHAA